MAAEPDASTERIEPGDRSSLDVSAWDDRAAVRSAAHRELGADVQRLGVTRLAGIAALSALVTSAYLLDVLLLGARFDSSWRAQLPMLRELLLGATALSLATFALTKLSKLRPQHALDLGYLYLFAFAFLLGLIRHCHAWPAGEAVRQVSPVVLPILGFGALVPAAPRTSLSTLFGAAAMDPLATYVLRAHGPWPPVHELVLLWASPFLAALLGYRMSLGLHRLTEGIVKARQIGSYRLVSRIGVGGMAEVWRAEHRMLARPAAIKLIRPRALLEHGVLESERLLRLFLREAQTTASLSSPHTIQIYDFGISREGTFYYVMELLNGLDLKTLVETYGPQSPERSAHFLRQACRSLHEAHERNFVHRDVKPSNIFTCRLGAEPDFVKVLDFGLVLDRHPTAAELEETRRFVGTPAIMAPEMVRFQAPVDARADIYALGCVGYFLLTGKRVFEAETRHDMLIMHAHQKPVLPSRRIGSPIDAQLEALVMACLEKNPDRRPQTARELEERLAELVFERPWTDERAELWWKTWGARATAE
ncbi:MAG TPA: serine/threonine-protein kinase [Polyangiaceae bacterium]